VGLVPLLYVILALPALGVALVKPVIVGTTARSSRENVRSIGYSIYYTMVNVGSASGPFMASAVADLGLPTEYVFRIAAISVFIMLFGVLVFFKEPATTGDEARSLGAVVRNFGTVLTNFRFMLFLLIFSGYWIVFWQEFILLPRYIRFFVMPGAPDDVVSATTSRVIAAGPVTVIAGTVVVNFLTRRIPTLAAITLGTFVTSIAWIIVALQPTVIMAVVTLVVVALGEIIQSPRYYEYISRLAPPGQQGTYMGFAFLPIGIGSIIGGTLGGYLMHRFGEVEKEPQMIWWVVTAIGILTAVLLWVYDKFIAPPEAHPTEAQ
jgi:MFS family permease